MDTVNVLEEIVRELKKYPFTEKMLLCQQYSSSIMEYSHLNILKNPNVILPWELEVFAELSLFADGNNVTKTFKSGFSEFFDIINTIRNYQHSHFESLKGGIDFANDFIMVTGLQQFKAQENVLTRLFRFNYFWNFSNENINMLAVLQSVFPNFNYSKFIELSYLIYFYASLPINTAPVIKELGKKYIDVVNQLKLDRADYKNKQAEKLADNFENAIYGFNYLHSYPFIEFNNNIYIPLPYLVIDAVTESLLTRVTFGKNSIREKIGKEVAQSYIENIFKDSTLYEQVLPEQTYKIGKNKIDSPDVMIKQSDAVCFIDTKLSTPKLELRKFNKIEINDTISKYAKHIKQMYKRISEFENGFFYPFSNKEKIEKHNIFGIVAVLEDSYISKTLIYKEVFNLLKVNESSPEAEYIQSNIKITNFRDLELFYFNSYDIFVSLKKKRDKKSEWTDLGIYSEEVYKNAPSMKPNLLKDFEFYVRGFTLHSVVEMLSKGLLPRYVKV